MVMEVPKGYKQTEVGIIPEDWDVVRVSDVASSVTSGGTPRRENPRYWNGNIPWITTTQIDFYEILDAEQFITEAGLKYSSAKMCRKGILLIAMYGQGKTRGKVAILGVDAAINQACAAIKLHQSVDHFFVYQYLTNQYGKIRALSNSGGQENLSGAIVKSIQIALPKTRREQTAIAATLSDVDTLITSLTTLLHKKRQIKTATMQRLLTGKQRLPGFGEGKGMPKTELGEIPEDWEVCTIKDFAPLQRGFDLPNTKLRNGAYPVIYSNGAMNFHNEYMIEGEGVITGRSGTIGKVHYVKGKYWPHNTTLWVTRFKNSIPLYVYYLYGYIGFDRFLSGSGVPTLNRNDVHTFLIAVPKPEEQEAIANVLSDIDADLDTLETRLAKAKAIKQGMMQELLTGKTRLIQPQSQPDQGE